MDLDVATITPAEVVAPEAVDAPTPAPAPPARRGRGGARAQAPDRAPDPAPDPDPNVAPPAAPPLVTPERQAQVNALYSAKVKRDADYLQETHNLKAKLA